MTIENLSYSEKLDLLTQLAKDPDTKVYFEVEVQDRLNYVLLGLEHMLTDYIKKLDERHDNDRRNIFYTSVEGYIAQGEGNVAAAVLRKIREFKEDEKNYPIHDKIDSTLDFINRLKNNLINNSYSDALRGKPEYRRVLKWEGQLADILEDAMTTLYLYGLKTNKLMPQERIDELTNLQREESYKIASGSWDDDRIMDEVIKKLQEMEKWEKKKKTATKEEIRAHNAMEFARMFMPSGNTTQDDMKEKMEIILK